jgi:hypothetical protein
MQARLPSLGVNRAGWVEFAPENECEVGAELFDVSRTGMVRPWKEKKLQAFAIARAYREIFDRTGDVDMARVAGMIEQCGRAPRFIYSYAEAFDEWHRWLLHAEFCRNRHCPICNWRRSLRLGYEPGAGIGRRPGGAVGVGHDHADSDSM